MPAKAPAANLENAITAYLGGLNVVKAVTGTGVSPVRLSRELKARGLMRSHATNTLLRAAGRRAMKDLPMDVIVARYLAGESEKALADAYGTFPIVIKDRLERAGVPRRGRSEAMFVRMARTSPEERSRLSAAAHDAVRGRVQSQDEIHKRMTGRAITNARAGWIIGSGEAVVGDRLRALGLAPVPQFPVDTYNIDLALHPVAVEVTVNTRNPMGNNTELFPRAVHLGKRGWHVAYIWITKRHFLTDAATDQIVALYQSAKRDPTAPRRYWVVRGSGEIATSGRLDSDE